MAKTQDTTQTAQDAPQGIIIPPDFYRMAKLTEERWQVPVGFTLALASASDFGKSNVATNNFFQMKAWENEPRNQEGYSWFGDAMRGFFHFGHTCTMKPEFKKVFDQYQKDKDVDAYVKAMSKAWGVDVYNAYKNLIYP